MSGNPSWLHKSFSVHYLLICALLLWMSESVDLLNQTWVQSRNDTQMHFLISDSSHCIFTFPCTMDCVLKAQQCCHAGFIAVITTTCFWTWKLLSAVLLFHCRCLTTPPNPGRRRSTVTPQTASRYSSSLMPVLSPSLCYPAWGKEWSVSDFPSLTHKHRQVVYQCGCAGRIYCSFIYL